MAKGRIGELALKAPVPKQELEKKGNKDYSEDGQQNLTCPFNIAPTTKRFHKKRKLRIAIRNKHSVCGTNKTVRSFQNAFVPLFSEVAAITSSLIY